jgi:hypothetical protein
MWDGKTMVGSLRKNYIALFFICVLGTTVVFAGSDEELFLRGNKYYEQKDYDNALVSYDMMSKKGRAVLYNMGNVCFHKGDYAQALVYWSRAEVGATAQEYNRIARNKEHTLTLLGKQGTQSFWSTLFRFIDNVLPYISLFLLQLFFLMCWYLFLFFVYKKNMKIKKTVLSCLCAVMAASGVMLGVYYTRQNIQNGIVVKKEAHLFAAPNKSFHKLCPLVYAHDVTVKEMRQGWYKIRYADMLGWVEADVVQII